MFWKCRNYGFVLGCWMLPLQRKRLLQILSLSNKFERKKKMDKVDKVLKKQL